MLKVNQAKFLASIAILNTTTTDHYSTFLAISKTNSEYIDKKT
jgi:hypothetical protein